MIEFVVSLLPDGLSPLGAFLLVFASFFTSGLTAAAGIGGGLTMLAVMAYLVPFAALIPVHGTVQLGSNTGRAFFLRRFVAWPLLAAFTIGAIPGALLGRAAVGLLPEAGMQALLGAFILVLAWVPMPKLAGIGRIGFALTGFVTTTLTMIFGATGPFIAVVLSKTFDDRRQLVATMASFMTMQHLVKVIVFAIAGFAFAEWLPLMVAMILTGLAGTWAGSRLLIKLPEKSFRAIFNIALSLVALDLIRRGLSVWLPAGF